MVPDIATLLAVAGKIQCAGPCDILVLPWRVSVRASSPSQVKFMAALVAIIRRLEPETAIVTGGGHPVFWAMLVAELEKISCSTRLIRTSNAGMVIIGAATQGSGIRSYRGGHGLDRLPLDRNTGPGRAPGSPESSLK